jgi:hypothetical protein
MLLDLLVLLIDLLVLAYILAIRPSTHEATVMMGTGTKEKILFLKETTSFVFSRISRLKWLCVSCLLFTRLEP